MNQSVINNDVNNIGTPSLANNTLLLGLSLGNDMETNNVQLEPKLKIDSPASCVNIPLITRSTSNYTCGSTPAKNHMDAIDAVEDSEEHLV